MTAVVEFTRQVRADLRSRLRLYRTLMAATSRWTERCSVLAFSAQDLMARSLARSAPRLHLSRDAKVRVRGTVHIVSLGSGEESVMEQLYITREYDQLPDFLAKTGWTVLDIGANCGMFAIYQARRGAHVHAFEPNPDCFGRLRRAIVANGAEDRVTPHPEAVGAVPRRATLVVFDRSTVAGTLHPVAWVNDAHTRTVLVPVTTLDDIIDTLRIARVDLLKIDVELAETDVLLGGSRALAITRRLVVECHSPGLTVSTRNLVEAAGFRVRMKFDVAPDCGYSILYASKPDWQQGPRVSEARPRSW